MSVTIVTVAIHRHARNPRDPLPECLAAGCVAWQKGAGCGFLHCTPTLPCRLLRGVVVERQSELTQGE